MRQALSLALYLLRHRRRLGHARDVLQALGADTDQELLTREASYIYLAARRAGDGDVLRAWTDALVQAAERIESDRRDAARYAVLAATPTDEDREWAEAGERAAADQWRER